MSSLILLTPSLVRDGFVKSVILVEAHRGDDPAQIQLLVHAPGLDEHELRYQLTQHLAGLRDINPARVRDAWLDNDSIIVHLEFADDRTDEAIGRILGLAEGFLWLLSVAERRPVFTLRANQRLVLVVCSYNRQQRRLDLEFPKEVRIHNDALRLCAHIFDALCRYPVEGAELFASSALTISIWFRSGGEALDQNQLQQAVTHAIAVLSAKALSDGPELVFHPVSLHHVPASDGPDDDIAGFLDGPGY